MSAPGPAFPAARRLPRARWSGCSRSWWPSSRRCMRRGAGAAIPGTSSATSGPPRHAQTRRRRRRRRRRSSSSSSSSSSSRPHRHSSGACGGGRRAHADLQIGPLPRSIEQTHPHCAPAQHHPMCVLYCQRLASISPPHAPAMAQLPRPQPQRVRFLCVTLPLYHKHKGPSLLVPRGASQATVNMVRARLLPCRYERGTTAERRHVCGGREKPAWRPGYLVGSAQDRHVGASRLAPTRTG
jgi:hypothetical protein